MRSAPDTASNWAPVVPLSDGRYQERIVSLPADDGRPLRLRNVRGERAPRRAPVMLVHGAGVRSSIFRAPVKTSIVDALVDAGHDVWLLDWRGSIDLPPVSWTLDQAARYDYPAAARCIVAETGQTELQAIVHCQGSTSFMMAAVAGLVPQFTTVLSNAVSLHPVVPRWSRFKLDWVIPLCRLFTPHFDPQWGVQARGLVPRFFRALANLTHRECDNAVCKLVSLVYGAGFPALWSHQTISERTHQWLRQEFGFVPLRFHGQMAACVRRGHLVAGEPLPELPPDYLAEPPRTDARFVFFAGEQNRCFLPESQVRTHRWFEERQPGRHGLHLLPGYGHLDVFMGDAASRDVFPLMIEELAR
jgi:hypothetical protein